MLTLLFLPIQIVMAVTILGLIVRGRWRMATCLLTYLAWGLVTDLLMVWDGAHFWRQWFGMLRQGGADLLKMAIALEIAWRAMRFFPGAASALQRASLAILAGTALTALAASIGLTDVNDGAYWAAIQVVSPRVQGGTLWLMVATLVTAHWYRVPLHSLHATLLASFATYQAMFLTLMTLGDPNSWTMCVFSGYVDNSVFLVAACVWALAVWRPERSTDAARVATLRRLEAVTSCG